LRAKQSQIIFLEKSIEQEEGLENSMKNNKKSELE